MSITGDAGGEPRKVGVALVDVMAGLHAAIGILAALRHRERDRRGPARRGRSALDHAVRAREPGLELAHRGRRAGADGEPAPHHRAVRDAPRRPTVRSWSPSGNDAQFRTFCDGRRRAGARRRRTVRHERGAGDEPRRARRRARAARSPAHAADAGSRGWATRGSRAGWSTMSPRRSRSRARPVSTRSRRSRGRRRAGGRHTSRTRSRLSATPATLPARAAAPGGAH